MSRNDAEFLAGKLIGLNVKIEGADATGKQGYILLDVLLALFLFSLGFAVLFGLTEGALYESRQGAALLEGANLAQKKLDQLAVRVWDHNFARQDCIPDGIVEGNEGKFHWLIVSNWDDTPELLRITVEVRWNEGGNPAWYKLESLYDVE